MNGKKTKYFNKYISTTFHNGLTNHPFNFKEINSSVLHTFMGQTVMKINHATYQFFLFSFFFFKYEF